VSDLFVKYAVLLAFGLSLSACSGNGSCVFSSDAGYDFCKDYLGSEFNSSVAQNDCGGGINGPGTYQSDVCPTAGALGFCTVWGNSTAINYRYTYTAADGSGGVSTVTLLSACGVAGGTFSTTQ
jgi:hypothetical protein